MTKPPGAGRRRVAGRPSKISPEIHAKIVGLLKAGNYLETASAVAGIDPKNLRAWIRKGARGIEPYRQFAADVEHAMGECEAIAVAMLRGHGRKDWRALAWWLERTRPTKYGQTLAVTAKVDEQLNEVVERLRRQLDPETFQRVANALDDAGGEDPPSGEARDPIR